MNSSQKNQPEDDDPTRQDGSGDESTGQPEPGDNPGGTTSSSGDSEASSEKPGTDEDKASGEEEPEAGIIGDLTEIMRQWPYESGEVNVRLFQAKDGRPVLQMRIDLGILQMEVNGRPDGKVQDGHETLLEAWVIKLQQHMESGKVREEFVLPSDVCRRMREEAIQFHHRYVSLFALDEYGGVIRDAEHNLRIMDFVGEFGETEFDRAVMEQLRPNTIMMRTRAEASKAVTDGQPKLGIAALDRGLEEIRESMLDEESTEEEIEEYEQSQEVQLLKAMRDALVPRLPVSQRSELQDRLRAAIAAENYELAAILRDELRMLKD